MIVLKNSREISIMRQAGRIAAQALKIAGNAVEPGVTTLEIDRLTRKYIEGTGARASFLGYRGYPKSTCISINSEVIHGIPDGKRVIRAGDIVSIDVAALFEGFHADNACTFACGDVSEQAKALMKATEESLYEGIRAAKAGSRVGDVSYAVQRYAEGRGYSVVREFVGHGVGANLHEDPNVPNFGTPGKGVRLLPAMTIAIEPMINAGAPDILLHSDGWLVTTKDRSLSAHYEHTVLITGGDAEIITMPEGA